MNNYEQMKNRFMVELNSTMPLTSESLNLITAALDRAIYGYELVLQETALSTFVDPIPAMVKTYIVVKKAEGLAEGTLDNYWRILQAFFLWARKQPEDITANDIRMFLFEYSNTHKISNRTLEKYREMICWFFSWAHLEEYISRNPGRSVKPIKHEIKERQSLSQIELEYLRMSCVTKRERAVVEFLYSTGCRVSELTIVKKSDINWHDRTVSLFGKGRKYRTSFINAKCEVALKEYLDSRDDSSEYLFVSERKPHNLLTKGAIEKIMRDLSTRCGLGKTITPHVLRHTTATQAANNGMAIQDVSELLGHSSVNTTMVYAKVAKGKVQAEHTRYVI